MTPSERRDAIWKMLSEAQTPVSASALASRFSVSRQIIVGDIALLRASGLAVLATPRGYESGQSESHVLHQIVCNHDARQIADELNTIVDHGCILLNVSVDHPVYGQLTGELKISSRYEISLFLDRLRETDALPLSALTEGVHMHTISCPDDTIFQRVTEVLREKGILLSAE